MTQKSKEDSSGRKGTSMGATEQQGRKGAWGRGSTERMRENTLIKPTTFYVNQKKSVYIYFKNIFFFCSIKNRIQGFMLAC